MSSERAEVLAVQVHALSRAGRHWFPTLTEQLAGVVLDLHGVTSRIELLSSQAGDPPALRDLVTLRDDLHAYVLRSMQCTAATGDALIRVADHFLATDEAVRAEYESLLASEPLRDRVSNAGDTLPRPGDTPGGGRLARPL